MQFSAFKSTLWATKQEFSDFLSTNFPSVRAPSAFIPENFTESSVTSALSVLVGSTCVFVHLRALYERRKRN